MNEYVVIAACAAAGTFVLAFPVRRLLIRFAVVQLPDERRVHARPTPVGGGAAMFLAFLVAMAVASRMPSFREVFDGSSEPLGVVLAAGVIFGVGFLDDLREVSAPAKAAGQVLAGSVLYLLGVSMFFFRIPFLDFVSLSPDLQPLVTVLWVMGMANAVNLIDGLDGLAAGIVAIASGAFLLYALQLSSAGLLPEENMAPLIAAITLGVCVGFLPHNFHPARIFMGDAGALFLGLLMAASTLVVGGRTEQPFSGQTYFFYAPIFVPFFVMGVPILDVLLSIIRRSRNFAVADNLHLHYRLMHLGHGHRRSVVILWAWTAILSAVILYPTFTNRGNALVPIGMAALVVLLYTFFHPGIRRGNGHGHDTGSGPDDGKDALLGSGRPAGTLDLHERDRSP